MRLFLGVILEASEKGFVGGGFGVSVWGDKEEGLGLEDLDEGFGQGEELGEEEGERVHF
jgi:hypothetical protein